MQRINLVGTFANLFLTNSLAHCPMTSCCLLFSDCISDLNPHLT